MDSLTERLTKKGKKQKGGGTKKHNRNKVKCAFYRAHRYVKNKVRKLEKHISLYPNDVNAVEALNRLR